MKCLYNTDKIKLKEAIDLLDYDEGEPILLKVKERLKEISDDDMENISLSMGNLEDSDWDALRDYFEEYYLKEN